MSDPVLLRVGGEERGQRLDLYLVRHCPGSSRSALTRLVRDGRVTVNGRPARKAGQPLEAGDLVTFDIPPAASRELVVEDRPLDVVYEDADILVVDKPAGVAVHPGPGHAQGTLVNALLGRAGGLSRIGGLDRPGIVHRLDKDTSGLLLVAKTDAAHAALARQLKDRKVEKVYLALLHGHLDPPEGVIDAPIARDPRHRQRMAVVPGGREAATDYRVLRDLGRYTLVEAHPRTGRTHQIRVHFASVGHPVAGDKVYGRAREDEIPRLFLHAHRLEFRHPRTGEPVSLTSPLASDLEASLAALRRGETSRLGRVGKAAAMTRR